MCPTADYEGARRSVSPTSERLETERLAIRRFADSDLEPFLAYRNDPEVARYQSWDSCTEREASAMIEELKSEQPGTPAEWFQFAIGYRVERDAPLSGTAP